MGYDGRILGRAAELYEQSVLLHEHELDERANALETRFPRLREIDIQLRRSVIRAINTALSAGADAGDGVRRQQEINRALRVERAELLEENGFPGNYLDREPLCSRCGDSGYTGDGMCACLRDVYLEEQKRELSHTIGISPISWRDVSLPLFSDEKPANSRISPRDNIRYVIHVCQNYLQDRCRDSREAFTLKGEGP